jgi:hypothetical protein
MNRLVQLMSAMCLALMLALMLLGGATWVELAMVGGGAAVMMTTCLLADRRANRRCEEDRWTG